MNWLDYVVLVATMVGIAAYGVWRTRGRRDLNTYLKGAQDTPWLVIGLSANVLTRRRACWARAFFSCNAASARASRFMRPPLCFPP